jgi:RHS repeat-associated protein
MAVEGGRLRVTFTEPPDLTTVTAAIEIDGQTDTWTLAPDAYTLESAGTLDAGSHGLTVGTGLRDLAGTALPETFEVTFSLDGLDQVVYLEPDPDVLTASTVGNPVGFHGLPADPATGLIYARHRWYDPELARFTTVDPMGFADSPNPYQYALNNPLAYSDPLGLCVDGRDEDGRMCVTGEEVLEFGVGMVVGLFSRVFDMALGTADMVAHPGETAGGLFGVIIDPSRLNDSLDAGLRQNVKGLASPDPGTAGEAVSGPLLEGLMAVGTAGAGTAARTASRLARAGRVAERAADVSRWSRRASQGARAARRGLVARAVDDVATFGHVPTRTDVSSSTASAVKRLGGPRGTGDPGDYIYRGVHANHPNLIAARRGSAVPGNRHGTATPEEHNLGGVSADSPFTSWTRDPNVAASHALKEGPRGVILRVPTGPPPKGASRSWQWSPDIYHEQEVLLRGIRHGAEVLLP